MYLHCDDDIISSSEGILFECLNGPKVVTISEDMFLNALRKTIMDVIGSCRILLDLSYRQLIYVGDSCVQYKCMKLKHDDDVGKIFFIFS